MSSTIEIGGLAAAISSECRSYGKAAEKVMKSTIRAVAKEAVKKVERESPKDTGDYKKGWRVKNADAVDATSAVVHNKTDYQLTHSLEDGHALPQGGRAKAYPHIKPVQDWVNEEAVKRLEVELNEIG